MATATPKISSDEEIAIGDNARKELARRYFLQFCPYVRHNYVASWAHDILCETLDRWVKREIPNLMIFWPPRHGKSRHVSEDLPAYILGKHPDCRVVSTSYNITLAKKFGRRVKRIMHSAAYRELFPGSRVPGSGDYEISTHETFDLAGGEHEGGYQCVGIGGGLTGHGYDYGIVDDPFKGRKEADSIIMRDAAEEWWDSVFYTRDEGNSVKLLMHTRWHSDDLAGRLLSKVADDEDLVDHWHVLCFPALKDDGDIIERLEENPNVTLIGQEADKREPDTALLPWKFTTQKLKRIRANIQQREWSSLYGQNPQFEGGNIIKDYWFNYYHQENAHCIYPDGKRIAFSALAKFVTVDLATSLRTSADYTVVATWGGAPSGDLFLLDLLRGRLAGPEHVRTIQAALTKWNAPFALIESNGFQLNIIQNARRKGLAAREIITDTDKVSRALASTSLMEEGRFWLPVKASWLTEYHNELTAFPKGANDDQVDATSFGCIHWMDHRQMTSLPPETPPKPRRDEDDDDEEPMRIDNEGNRFAHLRVRQ